MNATTGTLSHVRFISAGAGSGKTYRLTEELESALVTGRVTPAGVIGTTFTVKAASELENRVRMRLIESGQPLLAEQMAQAMIGTVHSVCERLLNRFSFELGLSPQLDVASTEDGARLFNQALDEVLDAESVRRMNRTTARLGLRDDRAGTGWQDQVKRIADQARSNDIEPAALARMGIASAGQFLGYFPVDSCDQEANQALRNAIETALSSIDLDADTTKTTATYVRDLRAALPRLKQDNYPWSLWISLSKKEPGAKSKDAALGVRTAASCYDRHPEFQADIREYVEGVFAIAGQALARFQAIKTERGLIDYGDMEQLSLRALDEPSVTERLDDELELLLVDEFQDTNPMQLGLFMKLARYAKEVIFVGDVKQAIYGFRGTDPELVHRTLETLTSRGCTLDVLERSWRSRPSLVHYLNGVFTRAFEKDGVRREHVDLVPQRSETLDTPVMAHWLLPKSKAQAQALALAGSIANLVTSQQQVQDPDSDEVRPVTFGDIAILAATNTHVETIAEALRERHVPMKMTLSGLLGVPEVCLAKACLRRLNDSTDTLASAEIRSLAACEDPEIWLADRLHWLSIDGHSESWGESDHPIISRLATLRKQTLAQSPVEIVARVLNYIGIRPIVTAWGPDAVRAAQRQRNLDAFLALAIDYEDHCAAQHEAATLTGFLFWVENPSSPELDLQPVVTGGNAVHVLTYHRAKGLEWPVVVATDLHYTWRARLWDVRAESTTGEFDLDNPLAGRSIRFYPNVFGRNTRGIPLLDAIMASDEAAAVATTNEAELRRLAYVGMTRARDTLVLALPVAPAKQESWIGAFHSEQLLPGDNDLESPEGAIIPTETRDLSAQQEGELVPDAYSPSWFQERIPTDSPVRERLSPSASEPVTTAIVGEVLEVGPRIGVSGNDMASLGSAIHAVIAAELINAERDDALEGATDIINAFSMHGTIAPGDALQCARRLKTTLSSRFAPERLLVEYPVEMVLPNGQVMRGWIDLLLETSAGWIVIDHKSSPRPRSEWATEALEHSGQLAAYAHALEAAGRKCAGCWVHFPVSGGLVEVVVPAA